MSSWRGTYLSAGTPVPSIHKYLRKDSIKCTVSWCHVQWTPSTSWHLPDTRRCQTGRPITACRYCWPIAESPEFDPRTRGWLIFPWFSSVRPDKRLNNTLKLLNMAYLATFLNSLLRLFSG